MCPGQFGVGAARVHRRWELRLRVRRLAAVPREANDVLRRDSATNLIAFGQPGDAEQLTHRRAADQRRRPVHAEARNREPHVDHFRCRFGPRHASRAGLIVGFQEAQVVAPRRARNQAGRLDALPALCVAEKALHTGAKLMVQLNGAFVIVQPVAVEIAEIVANSQVGDRGRRHRSIRRRQVVHHIARQSRHRHRLAGRDHSSRRNGLPRRRRVVHRHADVHRQHAGAGLGQCL